MKKFILIIIALFFSVILFAYSQSSPSEDELKYKADLMCSSFRPSGMAVCGANGSLLFDGRQGTYDRYSVQCFCSRTANGYLDIPGVRKIALWDRNNGKWAGH